MPRIRPSRRRPMALPERFARACEFAASPPSQCVCRCGGVFHGASIGDSDREAGFENGLRLGDPHAWRTQARFAFSAALGGEPERRAAVGEIIGEMRALAARARTLGLDPGELLGAALSPVEPVPMPDSPEPAA